MTPYDRVVGYRVNAITVLSIGLVMILTSGVEIPLPIYRISERKIRRGKKEEKSGTGATHII